MKQQQNIFDGVFKSTPAHVDGIAKGKSRRNKGNFKEKAQDKSKEKPSDSLKEKNPDQKCQRCLGKLHLTKTCPARFSKCNKCSKIGHWAHACKSSKPGKVSEVAEEEESLFL